MCKGIRTCAQSETFSETMQFLLLSSAQIEMASSSDLCIQTPAHMPVPNFAVNSTWVWHT